MNNDEKILKALENLQADVSDIKKTQQEHSKRLDNTPTKDDIERLEDREALIEREIYAVQKDQAAIKGMITLLNSNVVKTSQNQEKRIKNLEEHTGTENPLKH